MKRIIISLLGLTLSFSFVKPVKAVVDPLAYDNNKVGVHILHTDEVEQATKLVNANDGKWGYVTVPIETTDRNREKWNKFMEKAEEKKVIPIIRIATLVRDAHWEEPESIDLIAFANFLNDLDWPTKNRYVIVFNEVNRNDEFGGLVNPSRYADILVNTSRIFKDRDEDFFILPAGLDLASVNANGAIEWRNFWRQAYNHNPKIFEAIDGWTSHSYPNPGFAGDPRDTGAMSISGFKYELDFVSIYTDKKLPVFITETGWDQDRISEERVAAFYDYAFDNVWSDVRVVAVTPFLLSAGDGPFEKFSLLDKSAQPTEPYKVIAEKTRKGSPELAEEDDGVLGVSTRDLLDTSESDLWGSVKSWWGLVMAWFRGPKDTEIKQIKVGDSEYTVKVADEPIEHGRGLPGVENLADNEGMWFVFEEKGIRSFWMKGMNFDIDIVWISDGKVVGVDKANHSRPYKTHVSPEKVDRVLEVTANSGIKVGDKVKVLN